MGNDTTSHWEDQSLSAKPICIGIDGTFINADAREAFFCRPKSALCLLSRGLESVKGETFGGTNSMLSVANRYQNLVKGGSVAPQGGTGNNSSSWPERCHQLGAATTRLALAGESRGRAAIWPKSESKKCIRNR